MPVNKKNKSVSVVHLIWLPYGIDFFHSFLESYKKFPAGYEHDLVLLFNGVTNKIETKPYHELISSTGIEYKSFYLSNGQDITAYSWIAGQLNSEFILFFNSFSTFMAENWLFKYMTAIPAADIGIVGATASMESHYSAVYSKLTWIWEKDKPFNYNFRKYKLFLKVFFYWRWFFKPFPSPHIRTNAFIIRRELFLEIVPKEIRNKFEAYRFENGRNSLTVRCEKRKLKALVIDKNGKTYLSDHWKESCTYRINDQKNLLISDNRTKLYSEGSLEEKKLMTKLSWGVDQ